MHGLSKIKKKIIKKQTFSKDLHTNIKKYNPLACVSCFKSSISIKTEIMLHNCIIIMETAS